jgi:hypothetical protein
VDEAFSQPFGEALNRCDEFIQLVIYLASCAAEYSAARAPWRLDVSGGTMNPSEWGSSNGMNSSEIAFC